MSDVTKLYANMTLQSEPMLQKRKEEEEKIKTLGVEEKKMNVVISFYRSNSNIKIGDVSRCLGYLIKILRYIEFTDIEISEYINKNQNTYINEFEFFKERLTMFDKCGRLKYIIKNKPGLLSLCRKDTNENIRKFLRSRNYKITEEELDSIFLEKEGKVKMIKLS